jgi:UDP-galactose transporter
MRHPVARFARTAAASWHVVLAICLMTTQPLLTEASQSTDGTYAFSMLSVTFFAEVAKLAFSIGMYALTPHADQSHGSVRLRDVFQFAVPALVYFLNNNMVFLRMSKISSTDFQILSCLKTVFTAILFRCILSRSLSVVQWASIVTLACGAASSQMQEQCGSMTTAEQGSGDAIQLPDAVVGALATVASCLLSSFAGVYSELLLKKDGNLHSIHLQNLMLYAWGVVLNLISMFVIDGNAVLSHGVFYGYSQWTWGLLANNAIAGLAISAVLKYADNIVCVFAHTGAMVITATTGVVLMGETASPQLPLAIGIVAASTTAYASEGSAKSNPSDFVFLGRERASATRDDQAFELYCVAETDSRAANPSMHERVV